MAIVVEVSHLKKSFRGVVAVEDVSFRVYEGEVFGLIGPNGAGKTTTLRMLVGLVRPDSGVVRVMGYDPFRDPDRVRELVGYLPEDADVYSRLSGFEHLRFYAELYGANVEEAVKLGSEVAGLGRALYQKAGGYSKGMKRRLLLGIVLMRKPRISILDEPTSGLDVYSSIKVRELITRFVRETGSTVILSSHNMLEVEYLCDRIAFINKGRIVEEGSPSELKEKYRAQNLEEVFVKATGG
ncbi:ABC transporter ATP-binding protein [Thermogladius sp. 4427co]|uniref:ABC transporter ATP-binding protein n=1 Tax=Thermogladius sp. 4427co TaxID=3450718 RepID=UPI003F7AF2DE